MKLEGWVGTKTDRRVTGWVADLNDPNASLHVRVRLRDWISPVIHANEHRDHIRARNFGTACYGFSVRIPNSQAIEETDRVSVAVTDLNGNVIANLPTKGKLSENFFKSTNDSTQSVETKQTRAISALAIIAAGAMPERRALSSVSDLERFAHDVLQKQELAKLLRDSGRSLIQVKNFDGAVALLSAAESLNPSDKETLFQLGIATGRAGSFQHSLACFRKLYPGQWRVARVLSEYAQALRRAIESSGHNPAAQLVEELQSVVAHRLSLKKNDEGLLPSSIARTLSRFGLHELALQALDQTHQARPGRKDVYVAKAQTLIEARRIDEGLEVAKDALAKWPDDETAQHMVRVFSTMRGGSRSCRIVRLELSQATNTLFASRDTPVYLSTGIQELRSALAQEEPDWVMIGPERDQPSAHSLKSTLTTKSAAGCIRLDIQTSVWRSSALLDALNVLDDELVNAGDLAEALGFLERFYVRPAPATSRGTAVLLSRHGAERFGGAEHFLFSAAEHYRSLGFDPLIVGYAEFLPEGFPAAGEISGIRYAFIEPQPQILRRLLVSENATYVHAISGTGFLTAEAVGEMNIPFIYGVHYFRDVLGGVNSEVYFDHEGQPIPRPDFSYIFSRASAIYANSKFTQKFMEQAHGTRCPILFSVPEEQTA